jgi:hypothetical protein
LPPVHDCVRRHFKKISEEFDDLTTPDPATWSRMAASIELPTRLDVSHKAPWYALSAFTEFQGYSRRRNWQQRQLLVIFCRNTRRDIATLLLRSGNHCMFSIFLACPHPGRCQRDCEV